jgi:RNA polymerase-binding protein DksA
MWLRKEQGSVVAKAASKQAPPKAKAVQNGKPTANGKPSGSTRGAAKASAVKPASKSPPAKAVSSKPVAAKSVVPAKVVATKPQASVAKAPPVAKVAPIAKVAPVAVAKATPVAKTAPIAKPEPAKVASKSPAKSNGNPIVHSKARNEQAIVITPGPKLGSIAGRNLPPAKAPRPIASNEAMIAAPVPTNDKPRKNQAGFLAKELEHFRDLLLAKRGEIVGDMSAMEREALRTSGGSNLSTLPIHMADMGTDNYEQEFTLSLVETDRKLLREINNALAKIQNGTYGICEGTGKPISKARLEVQPWARYSIEYAKQMERAGR